MLACGAIMKKAGTAGADPAFLHAEHCRQDCQRGNQRDDHQDHFVASIQSFVITTVCHVQAPKWLWYLGH